MAHLITGNKFDPEKDIPDLSGKVVHREDLYIVRRSILSRVTQLE